MATTKAKKPVAKKAPAKKKVAVRKASTSRRQLITRSDEYTQLTWILIAIWIILIAVFLGTVIKQVG